VDKVITDLEKIKQTPNYDEHLTTFKPFGQLELNASITCVDIFDTHNIKKTKFSKAILGTLTGSILIHDFEMNRMVVEKVISPKVRIDIIASTTVKFYDTFITRIAIVSRGDPNVYTYTFNHAFAVINPEFTINLNKNNLNPGDYPLEIIPSEVKFSNDSYFMYIIDYSGGIRIYKFFDIPKASSITDGQYSPTIPEKSISNQIPSKGPKMDVVQKGSNTATNNKQADKAEKKGDDYLLIYQGKYNKTENYVPFNLKKPEESKDPKDKNKKKDPKNQHLKRARKSLLKRLLQKIAIT